MGESMEERFDASRAFVHIERLARLRRLPGTPGEADARAYIKAACAEGGLEMAEDIFHYTGAPLVVAMPLITLGLALLCVAGSVVYLVGSSVAMFVLGIVILGALFLSFKWSATFESFAAKDGNKESSNLLGTVEGRTSRGTVIVSAHYDSKSQLMPVSVRVALYLLGFMTAGLFAFALIAVGAVMMSGPDLSGSTAGFVITLLPAVCLLALSINVTGNRSPGALDDASGISVILELGRLIKGEPLRNLDLVVACFGCEEVGLVGSSKYMNSYAAELKESGPLYMLNFDMPFSPSGSIFLSTAFEMPPVKTSAVLNEKTREAAKSMGIELKGVYLPVGAAADHMPWVKNGYEATCFVSPATFVHSSRDTVERINREGLRRAGDIALETLRLLDQSAGTGGAGGD
jgi:Zn-dependent M28 family amino/carboxypeptidase